jgi:hypothetical protein
VFLLLTFSVENGSYDTVCVQGLEGAFSAAVFVWRSHIFGPMIRLATSNLRGKVYLNMIKNLTC